MVIHGVRIVSLVMEAKERLCLAQISNTLLKADLSAMFDDVEL